MEHGFYHPDRGYWQTNSEPSENTLAGYPNGTVEVPLRPSAEHDWDGSQWVHNPPSAEGVLTQWRETATASRKDFCIACASAGILTPEGAIEAAKGNWPTGFESSISSLTQEEQLEVKIDWATTPVISRNHPVIALLASQLDMTEEQVDTLFGYNQ